MYKAYKFRLYPNTSQKVLINKTFGCVRDKSIKEDFIKAFDMCKEINIEYPF